MKVSQTVAQMEAKLAIYEQIRNLLNERETEDPQLSELLGELGELDARGGN